MRAFFRLFPVLVLLAGCAATPPVAPERPASMDERSAAEQALAAGDYHAAARLLSRMADSAPSPLRERYRLQAAEALLRAGLDGQALRLLDAVPAKDLPPELAMRRQLIAAELALPVSPDQTLSLLLEPAAPAGPTELQARYHELRAKAFAALGNHLETAREYVSRELFLTDPQAIESNQLAIWEALSHLSNEALEQLRLLPPPDVLSGWMELAGITKDVEAPGVPLSERIARWRGRYPGHPALPSFLDALEARSHELVTRPGQIAVLLPFSGRFAQAGDAVRDGLLAAHYASPERDRMEIRFYDEGSPVEVVNRYLQAVEEGAEVVIGPLDKDALRVLAESPLPIPTIALNRVEDTAAENLFQFGLTPEDEARQVAEYAWLDGHEAAAVLVPEGAWGSRLRSAFLDRWEELGGTVAAEAVYQPDRSDFAEPIKAMLALDKSELRRRTVQDIIRQSVEFEPRRRQDVDFIFLGAFPRQARLIRPQLRFHHAIGLPVIGTSHVYAAIPDPAQDRDMDGVVFGDMPWTLDLESPFASLRRARQETLLRHGGSMQRLVALGVDAYHLIPRLKLLDRYPRDRFQGETGLLYIDDENRVRRQLTWARFRKGEPHKINLAMPLEPADE